MRPTLRLLYLLIVSLLGMHAFAGCHSESDAQLPPLEPEIARGFTIRTGPYGRELVVLVNPNDSTSKQVAFRFGKGESSDSVVWLAHPVRRIATLSTSHVGLLHALGAAGRIVAAGGTQYLSNKELRKGIDQGQIPDIGSDLQLDYERLITAKPELLVAFSMEQAAPPFAQRVRELGIPLILLGEWRENHPIARLEWIRALGFLLGLEERADSVYLAERTRYRRLCDSAGRIQESDRPKVLFNMPWKESWFMPGGRTFMAQIVVHAGGLPLTGGFDNSNSNPIPFERALALGMEADYWLHPSLCTTLNEVKRESPQFGTFKCYLRTRIYNNNRSLGPTGGNTYWEDGVAQPSVILADLIRILQPAVLPEADLVYYRKLLGE